MTGAFVLGTGLAVTYLNLRELRAEDPSPEVPDIEIEKPKAKKGLSKEANRALISSQHLQVKSSWENPGVYAWGSNAGKVVAPDSDETNVKNPRRIAFFDGALLRGKSPFHALV